MKNLIGMWIAIVAMAAGACVSEGDSSDDTAHLIMCDDVCAQEAQWCDNDTGLWTCGLPEDGGFVCDNPDKGCEIQ